MYDYREAVTQDILDHIRENGLEEDIKEWGGRCAGEAE